MVDGLHLEAGQIALFLVEEEPGPGPEPATTLSQLMVEQIVRENILRHKIVILTTAQVNYY